MSQGIHKSWITDVFYDFKKYWTMKEGKKALKFDWEGAWRVWCRKEPSKTSYPKKLFDPLLSHENQFGGPVIENSAPVIDDADETIASIKRKMLAEIGDASYKSWIQGLEFEISGSTLNVYASMRFARDWVANHYADMIKKCSMFETVNLLVRAPKADSKAGGN